MFPELNTGVEPDVASDVTEGATESRLTTRIRSPGTTLSLAGTKAKFEIVIEAVNEDEFARSTDAVDPGRSGAPITMSATTAMPIAPTSTCDRIAARVRWVPANIARVSGWPRTTWERDKNARSSRIPET